MSVACSTHHEGASGVLRSDSSPNPPRIALPLRRRLHSLVLIVALVLPCSGVALHLQDGQQASLSPNVRGPGHNARD